MTDVIGRSGSRSIVPSRTVLAAAWLAASTAAAAEPEVVIRAEWGAEPGQLGKHDAAESAPEGPMSFAVAPGGDVWILDQVNRRLARFDATGRFLATLDLASETFQGLAVGPDGHLALMDRLAARVVRVLDPDGQLLGEVPLEGFGIAEGGGTTAVFARDDGVWVEYDHRRTVRVLDAQAHDPYYRRTLDGRPLGPGLVAGLARLDGPSAVNLRTVDRGTDTTLAETILRFDEPVRRLVELAGDDQGDVVLAVHLATEAPARDHAILHEELAVLVLDAALVERRRLSATPSTGPWEQFKELEVEADGTIWQLAFLDSGVEVRRWQP
ncbi:MAG: hypothetical protein HY907_10870 [Deltaproteobacteria bacterium]|nr:hypothetical protein [Deltaproteobacteria bacterium]